MVIEKRGLIFIIKDRACGRRYAMPMAHMRALIFGGLKFIYANEYIPKPDGRPQGSKDSYQRERTPKNKIIKAL